MRLAALISLSLALAGCGGGEERADPPHAQTTPPPAATPAATAAPAQTDAFQAFVAGLDAGADCPELFALRNVAKQSATPDQENDMNTRLQTVGCHSSTSTRQTDAPDAERYTVKEYRIYHAVIGAPMSVSEDEAMQRAAAKYGVSVEDAKETTERVQRLIFANKWFGKPEAEIQHASDWNGEKP